MIEVIKAPNPFPKLTTSFKLFLGGSIEMGKAEKWQDKLTHDLIETWPNKDLIILNPRRDDWDASWIQDPNEGSKFHEQVSWEMDAQESADLCVYYFAKDTISPITLLELGHYSNNKKTLVYVDPGYSRRGNVIMFCERHFIPYFENFEQFAIRIAVKIS